jgi:(4-(4-[2-(gamma-L-glutamylamino)ethyl]phenoxymethyl)furan-2-yl)methanamine synthase
MTTLAVDVGGANTKAAWFDGESVRTLSRPFEVWRDRAALADVLNDIAADPADAVAVTMTAELSDAFRTKREGVAFVLDAAQDAFGARPLRVLTTAGELVSVAEARACPLDVAAANWVATALAVADEHPDGLLIDVGGTTADIVPIVAGRVAANGRTDLERLLAGELVYTGALRTNLAAIAPRVPVRGDLCPVASECFAISADVHLVLGDLAPEAYDCPTPDGRPARVAFARERIARLVCADAEQLGAGEIDAIAAYLRDEQLCRIEEAARRVQRPLPANAPVVAVGSGAFLGRAVAARLGRPVAAAPAPWGATGAAVAPAAALAALLATRLGLALRSFEPPATRVGLASRASEPPTMRPC